MSIGSRELQSHPIHPAPENQQRRRRTAAPTRSHTSSATPPPVNRRPARQPAHAAAPLRNLPSPRTSRPAIRALPRSSHPDAPLPATAPAPLPGGLLCDRTAPGGSTAAHSWARARSKPAALPYAAASPRRAPAESLPDARNSLSRTHQNDPHIHYVRIRRPRDHQVAQRFEITVRIVFFQKPPRLRIAPHRVAIGH